MRTLKSAALTSLVLLPALAGCSTDVNVGGPRTDAAVEGGGEAAATQDSGGAADEGLPDGAVCTPDPPDAVISGTSGGQPDAPYCPWNGCLDGPKASCGEDGQWHCPAPPPPCFDSGSSSGGDAQAVFGCGTTACTTSEYCVVEGGGPMQLEGGSSMSYSCAPIPAGCTPDATCACIVPYTNDAGAVSSTNNACMSLSPGAAFVECVSDGAGGITVTCALP